MNKIFGNDLKDIPYISRLKSRLLYAFVIITVLLNFFLSLSLNFKKVSEESLFNPFIIVDLQNNLNEENKNKVEKYILSLNGVSSTRFMDKRESFRNLQNDLNISIPEASNPLSDSIIVSLKDIGLTSSIQETLEARDEIKEVYKDTDFFQKEEKRGLVFSLIEFMSAIVAVLLAFILIILFNLNIGIEFLNSVNVEKNFNEIIRISKIRNLLRFSGATILGTLLFFNVYVYFRNNIFINHFKYNMLSFTQILIWHLVILIFLNFIVWVLPASISKIDGGEE